MEGITPYFTSAIKQQDKQERIMALIQMRKTTITNIYRLYITLVEGVFMYLEVVDCSDILFWCTAHVHVLFGCTAGKFMLQTTSKYVQWNIEELLFWSQHTWKYIFSSWYLGLTTVSHPVCWFPVRVPVGEDFQSLAYRFSGLWRYYEWGNDLIACVCRHSHKE